MKEIVEHVLNLSNELKELKAVFNVFLTNYRQTEADRLLSKWIISEDVKRYLKISDRTLRTLRDNGTIAYSKIEGKYYYKAEDIESVLEKSYVKCK